MTISLFLRNAGNQDETLGLIGRSLLLWDIFCRYGPSGSSRS